MIDRPCWTECILAAWERVPIVWLTGVRRVGKTTLAKGLGESLFMNCDLPRTRELLRDPELFFRQVDRQRLVVFDEIHRTEHPSEILKIGADEFPHLKILATGSSTLAATSKFRDALTGRKRVVQLGPVLGRELDGFGVVSVQDRLLRGGLPARLLAAGEDPEFYGEWLDSYYARDVQELFPVARRAGFLKLCELLFRQSGGLAEFSSLAKHSGLSRPTVGSYLETLQATHLVRVLRPFHGGGRREILAQPKIYAFDTGFVAHFRGWSDLRPDDCGQLLEHLALDALCAAHPSRTIHFWRDKQQRESDFVIPAGRDSVTAIECKWSPDQATARNLDAFREHYPKGDNLIVSARPGSGMESRLGRHRVRHLGIAEL